MINIYYYTGPTSNKYETAIYMFYDTDILSAKGNRIKGYAYKMYGFRDHSKESEKNQQILDELIPHTKEKVMASELVKTCYKHLEEIGLNMAIEEVNKPDGFPLNMGYLFDDKNKEKWEYKKVMLFSKQNDHVIPDFNSVLNSNAS